MSMFRRSIVFWGLLAACVGESIAATHYLSADGDDAADGLTPATAWRTVRRLNRGTQPGDTSCLRRGDVFYGTIRLPGGLDAGHSTAVISYGEGPKPVVSCTKNLRCDPAIWEAVNAGYGIWRTNLCNPANYGGLVDSADANPGFLLVDGRLEGWRKFFPDDVNKPWEFSEKNGWLYVHATNNPALLAKDIRVSLNAECLNCSSNTVVRGLCIRNTGGHGMYGGWSQETVVSHVRISDCDFENIGGSELINYSGNVRVRYGNGVEFGSNCRDAVVERCEFRATYDVAVTMQGYPKVSWSDVHVRNCTMTDCTQAFEVWCRKAPKGVGFERCSFTGNRTVNVGGGWGAEVRPNRYSATPLLVYAMDTDTVDISVTGNVFENVGAYGLIYNKSGGLDKLPKGYRIFNNKEDSK